MKRYQSKIAALLICILLLAGCGKAAEVGGSAGNASPETEQSAKKNDKAEASATPQATAAPTASPAATAAPTPTAEPEDDAQSEEGSGSEAEEAQQDTPESLSGSWVDRVTGMRVNIDDAGGANILWVQSDGTVYSWTCTVTRDASGVMHYANCTKLTQVGDEAPSTLYQNGTGTMTLKDGNLYWQDDIENIAANLTFEPEG